MVIEAMAPESGIEHLKIEGVACFRAIDLACTVYSRPEQRGLANAAVRIFVEAANPIEHMVHKGPARGRFFPVSEMGPLTRSLCDPANHDLARARFFSGLRAAKRAREAAAAAATLSPPPETLPPMTPLTNTFVRKSGTRLRDIYRAEAPNLEKPIHNVVNESGLMICLVDVAMCLVKDHVDSAGGYLAHWAAKQPEAMVARYSINPKGGRPKLFVRSDRIADLCEILTKREGYQIERVRPLLQRLAELETLRMKDIHDAALATPPWAAPAAAQDQTKAIIGQVMGGAMPFADLPTAETVVQPYPTEATAGIEELKAIQFEPKSKTEQLLELMHTSKEAQTKMASAMERLTERLEDAVEALRLAQAGIERRDEQIASLERLIALAGQHLTAAVRHHS